MTVRPLGLASVFALYHRFTITSTHQIYIDSTLTHCVNDDLYVGVIGLTRSWSDAQRYCETRYNTQLATIYNDEQNLCAYDMAYKVSNGGLNVWFGSYHDGSNWVNTFGDIQSYTNWNPNQPDSSSNGDCVEFEFEYGGWNDVGCSLSQYFICDNPKYYNTSSMLHV